MSEFQDGLYGLVRAHQDYYDCLNECGAGLPLIEESSGTERDIAHARHIASVLTQFIEQATRDTHR